MKPTATALKLKKYLYDNGIMLKWFAAQIGISRPTLSKYLLGTGKMPAKAYHKIVLSTKGKISMKELLNDFLNEVQQEEDQDDDYFRP